MSKQELIERIMRINRSARLEFLNGFTYGELNDYLRQLESVKTPLPELEPRGEYAMSA